MTVLSSLLGIGFNVIPRNVTLYLSAILFLGFGLKMLKDGYHMSEENAKEEYEEAQQSIGNKDLEGGFQTTEATTKVDKIKHCLSRVCNPVIVEAFVMCFLLEWGDKSQIATIILTSSYAMPFVQDLPLLQDASCHTRYPYAGRKHA
ncbi:hypothetical protein Ciccas_009704 [Cichlidogyrus casuarinus]|uniref:GDT1 family protein n=1 Tax=Cichlidogyrus casuarinus TaxID=1844966 RepID=A0ABD2PZ12_9PLAT